MAHARLGAVGELVAFQAFGAVEGRALRLRHLFVGVVTRGAPELAGALAVALAEAQAVCVVVHLGAIALLF